MNKLLLIFSLSLLLVGCGGQSSDRVQEVQRVRESGMENEEDKNMVEITSQLELKSSAFEHEGGIPAKYTCDGEDISPALRIENVTGETESLVLIVDDPDAPGGDWVHWLVWNVSPGTSEIAENSVPEGAVQGKTSFGASGYGGPCPPSGTHRYYFKLYALDKKLDLDSSADKVQLLEKMEGHVLQEAVLMGKYSRG